MNADLGQSSHPQRLVGAVTTLITLALLAFALRPTVPTLAEPVPEVTPIVVIKPPDTAPIILPVMPLQNIDLPLPMLRVNLPEFEMPAAASSALPTLAPITSPDASPSGNDALTKTPAASQSGNEALFGTANGTGRTNGTGSILISPVRMTTHEAPFNLVKANRSGLVTSLNFCVSDKGAVSDVQLAATSGFDDTDAIAIDWLGRQRFKPGTLDGVRVRMCATYDIRWTFWKATSFELQDAAKAQAAAIRKRSHYPRQFVYWPQDRPFPGCDAVTICRKTVQ